MLHNHTILQMSFERVTRYFLMYYCFLMGTEASFCSLKYFLWHHLPFQCNIIKVFIFFIWCIALYRFCTFCSCANNTFVKAISFLMMNVTIGSLLYPCEIRQSKRHICQTCTCIIVLTWRHNDHNYISISHNPKFFGHLFIFPWWWCWQVYR